MNASARALAAGTFSSVNIRQMVLSGQFLLLAMLLCCLLASACFVINIKETTRQQVAELHMLNNQHNAMMVEQGKLLLEQNTWSSPVRIQSIAQNQLGMKMPEKNIIVFVK